MKFVYNLRLRSHGNDIIPLSYRSDFWNGKVDCSHGSGPLSYPVLGPVHTGTVSYRSEAFRAKTSKRKSAMSTNFKHCRI